MPTQESEKNFSKLRAEAADKARAKLIAASKKKPKPEAKAD